MKPSTIVREYVTGRLLAEILPGAETSFTSRIITAFIEEWNFEFADARARCLQDERRYGDYEMVWTKPGKIAAARKALRLFDLSGSDEVEIALSHEIERRRMRMLRTRRFLEQIGKRPLILAGDDDYRKVWIRTEAEDFLTGDYRFRDDDMARGRYP